MAAVWGRWRPPVSWFPGHMAKAAEAIERKLRSGRAAPRAREAPEWAVLPTPRAQLLAEPKSVRGYTTHERARGLAPLFAQVFFLLLCSSVGAPPAGVCAAPPFPRRLV